MELDISEYPGHIHKFLSPKPFNSHIAILEAQAKPPTTNPFGPVQPRSAHLTISGFLTITLKLVLKSPRQAKHVGAVEEPQCALTGGLRYEHFIPDNKELVMQNLDFYSSLVCLAVGEEIPKK